MALICVFHKKLVPWNHSYLKHALANAGKNLSYSASRFRLNKIKLPLIKNLQKMSSKSARGLRCSWDSIFLPFLAAKGSKNSNRAFQSVVFNSGQKMALRAFVRVLMK